MNGELIALRLVHIVGGMFWVGSGMFTTFFLVPALTRSGVAVPQVMRALQERRLFTALPLTALLTILSGARLMWIMSAGFSGDWFASAPGQRYSLGAAAAILAFVLSLAVARPAAMRMARLRESLATADAARGEAMRAQLAGLQRRSTISGTAATILLLVAAVAMAIARYST